MKTSTIAAQLYTVRDFCKTEADLMQTLKKIKSIGYEAVQVSKIGPIAPERVKEICDEIGLTICATHTNYDRMKNDLDGLIYENKVYDNKYIGLGSMPEPYRASAEGFQTFARDCSEIAKKIANQGMHFIYHNHRFEFEKFDGRTGMDILFEDSDPEVFGFELDTYWVHAGGANPVDWIRKVEGRMGVIHLKDMAIVDNEQVYAEIGEGNTNWPTLIQACRDTNVEWYCVEQDICRRNPLESLSISYKFLKSMI